MTGHDLVYLIGPPAAGKSTLMAALTAAVDRAAGSNPFAHDLLYRRRAPRPGDGAVLLPATPVGVELGRRREGGFPGTDALPFNVQPKAVAWLSDAPYPLVVAEGDRLANRKFMEAAALAGWRVHLVYVTAPADVLDARYGTRTVQHHAGWRAGRATKADNLARWAVESNHDLAVVDTTTGSPAVLAVALMATVPALAPLAAS